MILVDPTTSACCRKARCNVLNLLTSQIGVPNRGAACQNIAATKVADRQNVVSNTAQSTPSPAGAYSASSTAAVSNDAQETTYDGCSVTGIRLNGATGLVNGWFLTTNGLHGAAGAVGPA